MVALPPKSNDDGDPKDPTDIAEFEQFETEFRERLPKMDADALARVEQRLHSELDHVQRKWLWSWQNRASPGGGSRLLNGIAAAAVVALVTGVTVVVYLAMTKENIDSPPPQPSPPQPVQMVVDELDVIIEQQVDPSAPPLFERPMIDLSSYESLIGEQHVTQR